MVAFDEVLLDTYLGTFMANRSGLGGEEQERFAALVKQASAALAHGHSCLQVNDEEVALLNRSPLVSAGDVTPLVVQNNRLYLHRYYRYESRLARQIKHLAAKEYEVGQLSELLDGCFGVAGEADAYQRKAGEVAVTRGLCIISGGPGTGKTTTVVRILSLLLQSEAELKIALAAPTGKAAMRLRESIVSSLGRMAEEERHATIPTEALTLHRLLGVKKNSPQFVHTRERPLPWDVIIVDEASMVDLAMMSKLVDALKQGVRLILLGDKDQLASVESGAVLSDFIHCLPENTVQLQRTYRFDAGIKRFAEAVNSGDGGRAWAILDDSGVAQVGRVASAFEDYIGSRYVDYMELVAQLGGSDPAAVFAKLNSFRVLCATRQGSRGVLGVNASVERYLRGVGIECGSGSWYAGRPVLITRNDYGLDLYNGDVGICLPDPGDGNMFVWFERPDGGLRKYLPYRLPQCETVFGMTIHKSQGSEFDDVLVVLPEVESQILSRELIYTAVTRARRSVRLVATQEVLELALGRKIDRYSGLRDMLDYVDVT